MNADPWILGISLSHNGAVCLMKGSKIVVAVQEERLSRIKRDFIYGASPSRALNYCLEYAGISATNLSLIVASSPAASDSPEHDFAQNNILSSVIDKVPIIKIPHHFGHAVSVFATSGLNEAAVLIIDGVGSPYRDLFDWEKQSCKVRTLNGAPEMFSETITLYFMTGGSVACIEKHLGSWVKTKEAGMPEFGSLGSMYAAVSRQIFGETSEAGKVMGLAPYGVSDVPISDFFTLLDGEFIFHDKLPGKYCHNERWPLRQTEYKNLAASAQSALEDAVSYLVGHLYQQCPSKNLCYAGGVALNSVINENIIRSSDFEKAYIFPAAEDSGVAIGAAYYGCWKLIGKNVSRKLAHDEFGKRYLSGDIATAQEKMPAIRRVHSHDTISDVVDLLCQGKIIGWFQGRSELGPRALGQRSILCDPRMHNGKELLNSKVKHREEFRPFAPAILLDEVENWFDMGGSVAESPFMLRVCPFRKDKIDKVPAVVHIDGTGRVQTVTREANGLFYELIHKFYEKTGVPMLLNTSFNINGEPIVETSEDALLSFQSTGIDYCVIEDQIFTKHNVIMFDESGLAVYERLKNRVIVSLHDIQARSNGVTGSGVESAKPAINEYMGSYENPTHGVAEISCNEFGMKVALGGVLSFDIECVSGDVFKIVNGQFLGWSIVFLRNNINLVDSIAFAENIPIGIQYYFSKMSKITLDNEGFSVDMTGAYTDGSRLLQVGLNDGKLYVGIPSQRSYETVYCGGLAFCLRGLPGYGIEFIANQEGEIVSAVIIHPDLSVRLNRV